MALDWSWTGKGKNETMFGHKDWYHLTGSGQKSNAEIIDALWGNQNLLHDKNKPGRDITPEGTHGLFNTIQRAAQREASWNSASGVNDWNYGVWGGQGFGKKDIDAARGMGASEYQLRQLYQRANQLGINTAGSHAQEIAANAPRPEWNYGAHGSWGFGMADVEAMDGDLDQLRGARDWASQHKLNIGPGVREHITGLEDDRRFEQQQAFNAQLLQQQQEQAAQIAQDEREQRDRIAAEQAAAMQSAAAGAEYGRLASMRGGGSQTLSASGAATFKGKGLRSSENRRGKRGTGQLRRPYGTSNLSIAATGKGNTQSTLNL